ncbi:hypothetical protein [Salipiger sp. PrR003]|uniref:hypothetical protein n=1 Tax=Salipiger sp. PrR003 TaxID=2706776 RepID=UPI0013DA06CF|nr:hypothetical protein [Salipiger sp. PrR003]NDV50532.1 hypothetical protein [Salipiger sp. PrR003]
MRSILKFLRNTTALLVLCGALLAATAGLAMKTLQLGLEVGQLSAQVAGAAAAQAKAVSAAVARTKAKAAADQKLAVSRAVSETRAKEAVKRKKAVMSAVTRTKARARLRRLVTAVPIAGVAAAAIFERRDFAAWKEENPGRDGGDYGCEIAGVSAQVLDEVLQELPEAMRPPSDVVLASLAKVLGSFETGETCAASYSEEVALYEDGENQDAETEGTPAAYP